MNWIDIAAIAVAWYAFGLTPTIYFMRLIRREVRRTTSTLDLRLQEHGHALDQAQGRMEEFSRFFMESMDEKLERHAQALQEEASFAAEQEQAGPLSEEGLRALVHSMVNAAVEEHAALGAEGRELPEDALENSDQPEAARFE